MHITPHLSVNGPDEKGGYALDAGDVNCLCVGEGCSCGIRPLTRAEADALIAALRPTVAILTADDREQIAEGIENFIMNGDPDVDSLWQPYVDKLRSLPAPTSTGTEHGGT